MDFALELRQQRADLTRRAQETWSKETESATAENREPSAEVRASVEKMLADADSKGVQAEEAETRAASDRAISDRITSSVTSLSQPTSRRAAPIQAPDSITDVTETREYRDAYSAYLRTGEQRDILLSGTGGNLVAPVQMAKDLVMQVANLVFIRKLAHIEEVNSAAALRVPVVTSKFGAAEWTGEGVCLNPDNTFASAHIDLTPQLLGKLERVSWTQLQTTTNIEALVNRLLAYDFAVTEEQFFLNGNGSAQPTGVFFASAVGAGIDVSRDQQTAGTAVISADDIIKMRYSLKQPYLASPSAAWVMNRTIVGLVRLLKDNQGRYLWEPSLQAGTPDTLLGIPLYTSEYAPNAVTSGSYVAVLGDFSNYWIAQYAAGFNVTRLNERYAECFMTGFLGREWVSGGPVLPEAFSRLVLK